MNITVEMLKTYICIAEKWKLPKLGISVGNKLLRLAKKHNVNKCDFLFTCFDNPFSFCEQYKESVDIRGHRVGNMCSNCKNANRTKINYELTTESLRNYLIIAEEIDVPKLSLKNIDYLIGIASQHGINACEFLTCLENNVFDVCAYREEINNEFMPKNICKNCKKGIKI